MTPSRDCWETLSRVARVSGQSEGSQNESFICFNINLIVMPSKPPYENFTPPKKIGEEDFAEWRSRHPDINKILGLENEKQRQQMIKDIIKEVPAFREMAKIILEKRDTFLIGSITATFKEREKHLIGQLSSELKALPVFVKPIDHLPGNWFVFNVAVPATSELIEDNDRDPDKIAIEQCRILNQIMPGDYRDRLITMELDPQILSPMLRIFNQPGFWILWKLRMRDYDEFWSQGLCESLYRDVQPFIGTDKYEYAMILYDKLYETNFENLMEKLKRNVEIKHSVKLFDTLTLHLNYSWLVKFGLEKEILKTGKIEAVLSRLRQFVSVFGRGISSMYIGEEKPNYGNVFRIITKPVFLELGGFVFSENTVKKCRFKLEG